MKRRKPIMMMITLLLITGMIMASVAPAYAASTKTIYVLTSVKQNGNKMNTFTYDSNGRLKKASLMYGAQKCKFQYNKKNQLTKYKRSFNEWCNFDYTYNSKGRLTKVRNYYTDTKNDEFAYDGLSSKYTYSSGKITKEVVTNGNKKYTNKFKYNSKGLLSKATIKCPNRAGTYKYKYDKKKNVTSVEMTISGNKYTDTYTNKYNSAGRLTKRTVASNDGENVNTVTYTYTYKKLKVSSKYASLIKAQQWLLINEGLNDKLNLNFAIPRNDYNGM